MKLKVILTLGVASLAFSACGGAGTANVANKTGNAANIVANSTGNAVNTVANTTSNVVNSNVAANSNSSSKSDVKMEGDVLKIDEAGIMMTVPKGFKFSKDGEDTIVQTEDEGVEVRFTVPKDGDYDKAVSAAATELDSYLDDVKITKSGEKVTIDGMEATSIHGTAKDSDKEDVEFDLTVIKAPKKPVLATIYAEKASMEKHGAEVQKFLQSVKKQ